MKLENPFPEYGYFGPEYFCDREHETEELNNMSSYIELTLKIKYSVSANQQTRNKFYQFIVLQTTFLPQLSCH